MPLVQAPRRETPSTLETLLPLAHDDLQSVEALLLELGGGPLPLMPQVSRYLTGAGGKRLRPLLCLLAARLASVETGIAVRLAAAGEMIHTASLLHDDVVDESPLRRGQPAAPHVFGNSVCVLMGDALMTRALTLVAELEDRRALVSLARCVRCMAIGEMLQLSQAGLTGGSLLAYARVVEGKTSALFAWCSTLGDLSPDPLRPSLRRFGRRLGLAFQIIDDVLDFSGDPEVTGKSLGADLREGKMTLPLHYALQLRPALRDQLVAISTGLASDEELAQLVHAVAESGAIEAARAAATLMLGRAHRSLAELPSSPWREHLHLLADCLVGRTR